MDESNSTAPLSMRERNEQTTIQRIWQGAQAIYESIQVKNDNFVQLILPIAGKRTCVMTITLIEEQWVDIEPQLAFPMGTFQRTLNYPFKGMERLLRLLEANAFIPQQKSLWTLVQNSINLLEERKNNKTRFFPMPKDYILVKKTLKQLIDLLGAIK